MSSNAPDASVHSWRSQGLTAAVHLACPHCQAPGVYKADDRILSDWPGCYVQPDDERVDQPVGDHCPNCKASRGPNAIKRLGEIWRKIW
jgi:hypothetical protein